MEQLVARRAHIRRGGHRFEALIEIKRVKDISRDGAVEKD